MVFTLAVLALGLGTAVPDQDAAAAPPGICYLAFTPPLQRPLLLEYTQEFKGSFLYIVGEERHQEQSTESKIELEMIDELTSWDRDRAEGTRRFVRVVNDTDGEVQDPPLNGLTTMIKRNGGQCEVNLTDGRYLPAKEASSLIRLVPSAGLWVELPREAKVGQNYVIDLDPIAPLLLSNDLQKSTGQVDALFESFDAATGIAKLRGVGRFVEQGSVQGFDMTLTYTCDCSIDVNTKERRLNTVLISGTYTAEGATPDGRVKFDGSGRYRSSVTTQIGDAVMKARVKVTRFRERLFRADNLGVCVALPSYYSRVEEPGSQHVFQRMVKGGRIVMVCIDYLEGDTQNPQAYYDRLHADLKRQFGEVAIDKVTSALGTGRSYLFSSRWPDGTDLKVRSEVYPLDDKKFLLFKLQADPDTLSSAMPEFAKARKSLQRLKG